MRSIFKKIEISQNSEKLPCFLLTPQYITSSSVVSLRTRLLDRRRHREALRDDVRLESGGRGNHAGLARGGGGSEEGFAAAEVVVVRAVRRREAAATFPDRGVVARIADTDAVIVARRASGFTHVQK